METYDLIVIGGGSGGAGAAITAGRLGLRTLWVEREHALGGTGVHALVNCWQPGYTVSPLAAEIAGRLLGAGDAVLTGPVRDTPDGRLIHRRRASATYEDSLRRWDDKQEGLIAPALTYEPAMMASLLLEMAAEAGVAVWLDSVFIEARTQPSADGLRRVTSVLVQTPEGPRELPAGHFVDATANINLARAAGCGYSLGREPRSEYEEPSAPEVPELQLNGCTLCFICRSGPDRHDLPRGAVGNASDYAHISQMPHGGYHVNLCFQLPGELALRMGAEATREYLLGNIARRWPLIRRAYGLELYGITELARRTGFREGPRLKGRYVLTENDYHRGNKGCQHPDCIAFTDHALDRHSPDGGCIEAENGPVGVPLRCLQPLELDNLLVASRGASFSSIACSAVRLQRTMIELGEAAAQAINGR